MLESENDSSMLKSSTIHLEFEIDSLLKPRTFHLHTESIHSQKPLANRQPILAHFWDQIYWTRERFFLWVYGIYEYKICLKTLRTVAHRLKPIFHLPFFYGMHPGYQREIYIVARVWWQRDYFFKTINL